MLQCNVASESRTIYEIKGFVASTLKFVLPVEIKAKHPDQVPKLASAPSHVPVYKSEGLKK
jgi:hypothetical protein